MRILFFGDSITDAKRNRTAEDFDKSAFGYGFVIQTAGKLYEKSLTDYEVINRGIGGDRIVDLYARVKSDLWNLKPDVISILIGVNDVWHEIGNQNGVEIERFDNIYRTLIKETLEVLPNAKIIINEPFIMKGSATEAEFDKFLAVKDYAKVAKKIASDYNLYYLPLQNVIEKACESAGNDNILVDGVHPTVKGAVIIANEWMKLFNKIEKEI